MNSKIQLEKLREILRNSMEREAILLKEREEQQKKYDELAEKYWVLSHKYGEVVDELKEQIQNGD